MVDKSHDCGNFLAQLRTTRTLDVDNSYRVMSVISIYLFIKVLASLRCICLYLVPDPMGRKIEMNDEWAPSCGHFHWFDGSTQVKLISQSLMQRIKLMDEVELETPVSPTNYNSLADKLQNQYRRIDRCRATEFKLSSLHVRDTEKNKLCKQKDVFSLLIDDALFHLFLY